MVDARLADGSRLHAVLPPLAPDGPCVSIRRFGARAVPLAAFGVEPDGGRLLRRDGARRVGTSSCPARRAPARRRVATRSPGRSIRSNGSSRSRRRPSCGSSNRTSSGSRPGPRTPRERARSACAISCAARCACGRIASSSARSAAARRSTCCRRATPVTTVRSRPCTRTVPTTRCARIETLALGADVPLAAARDPQPARLGDRRDRPGPARPRRPARDRRGRGARAPDAGRRRDRLLARVDGRLVVCAAPTRPARRPEIDLAREWSACAALIVAVVGQRHRRRGSRGARVATRSPTGCASIARRPARRMPVGLRDRIERALDAAALDVRGRTGAVHVGCGSSRSRPSSVSDSVDRRSRSGSRSSSRSACRSSCSAMHERRARQIAAAVPETLERVASELRSGGTVATAIGAVAVGDGPLAPDMARDRHPGPARRVRSRRPWARGRRNAPSPGSTRRRARSRCARRSAAGRRTRSTAWPRRCATGSGSRPKRARCRRRRGCRRSSSAARRSRTSRGRRSSIRTRCTCSPERRSGAPVCVDRASRSKRVGGWWMRSIVRSGSRA